MKYIIQTVKNAALQYIKKTPHTDNIFYFNTYSNKTTSYCTEKMSPRHRPGPIITHLNNSAAAKEQIQSVHCFEECPLLHWNGKNNFSLGAQRQDHEHYFFPPHMVKLLTVVSRYD